MKHPRRLTLVAVLVALIAVTAGAPAAASDDASAPTLVYSETYSLYIALFPAGWAPSRCALSVALNGGSGFCETVIDPVFFYPDGTTGSKAWVVDPSSPKGWSIPDPCQGVSAPESETWTAYVDGTNYPGSVPPPPLTDAQVECGVWLYGWWF